MNVARAAYYSPDLPGTFFRGDFSLWEQIVEKGFSELLRLGQPEGILQLGKPIKNGVSVITPNGDCRFKNLTGIHFTSEKVTCITTALHPKQAGVVGVLSLTIPEISLVDYAADSALSALKKFEKTGRRVFFNGSVSHLNSLKGEGKLLVVSEDRSVVEKISRSIFTQTVSDKPIYLEFISDELLPQNETSFCEVEVSDEVLADPLSTKQMKDDQKHIRWRLLVKRVGMEVRKAGKTCGYLECREELKQLSSLIPKTSTNMHAVYVELEVTPQGITLTKVELFDSQDMQYFDEGKYDAEPEVGDEQVEFEREYSRQNPIEKLSLAASRFPQKVISHRSYLQRHVAASIDDAIKRSRWVFQQNPTYKKMSYFLGTMEEWMKLLGDSLNEASIKGNHREARRISAIGGKSHQMCLVQRGEKPAVSSILTIEIAFIPKGNALVLSHAVPFSSNY